MTNTNNPAARITAQVACEAIINTKGEGMDLDTMITVRDFAAEQEVASLYIFMLMEVIDEVASRA